MELIRALRLDQAATPPRVAFVGAGGKSTAMFLCARQLLGPVLVAATTHLSVDQLDWADQHYFDGDDFIDGLDRNLPPGVTLFTGPLVSDSKRTQGVSTKSLSRIHDLAEMFRAPLLIEADGSRQLSLKAPGDHEPPIPAFVDWVVVVAGLQGLGKPLTSEWVYRPELFASLSGLRPREIITPKALAQVMTHPMGGLKNIPSHANRIALLNQADSKELQAQAGTLGSDLLPIYEAVISSSLAQISPTSNRQLQNPNSQSSIHAVYQKIAAVILAAGESRRFGSPKQLLDWHGKPLVWHVAEKALQAGMDPVLVVCGAEKTAIQKAVSDLPVEMVHNRDWQQGQGTSVKMGVQSVGTRSSGILFLLADQPQIPVSLMRTLIHTHARSLNPITGPMIDGQRANPVLFDRVTFDDLAVLSGAVGGRELFGKYGVDWIPWHDHSLLLDIDIPEDYLRLLEMEV